MIPLRILLALALPQLPGPELPLPEGLPRASAEAARLEIVPEESLVAVVTHRGGVAGGLAHDHLVAATNYAANLTFDPATPLEAEFEVDFFVEDLLVDDPALRRRWSPRLAEAGVLDEPFGSLSEGDRTRVRREMLEEGQLDAEEHPTVTARLTGVERADTTLGAVPFDHRVTVEMTVRGITARAPVAARYEEDDRGVTIEAVGEFRFRAFGIEPYSAYLGAVKNQDRFHVYLSLRAQWAPGDGGTPP